MRKLLLVFVIIFCCIAAGVIIDHSVLAESEKTLNQGKFK